LHEGSLGVAWPSIRGNFGLPLDFLGMILVASMLGVLVTSFNSGWFLTRAEFGILLVIANLVRAAGLFGYVLAPTWWLVIASAFLVGLGSGTIDSGMNTFVAARYGPGPLNWLHAFYGIGAMVSPLIMSALIVNDLNWRWGFVLIGCVQILLALYFTRNLESWPSSLLYNHRENGDQATVSSMKTLVMISVWLGILVFFFSTGVEIAVGQWSFTLFTEARGESIARAGFWISLFWGSLTVGRIIFGFITDRIGATRLLRLGFVGMMVGISLLWWNYINLVGFIGLALIGFWMAPVFPVMIGLSPDRYGQKHAANAIGFQVASAYLGGALIPALIGIVADAAGLEVIGILLFAGGVLTVTAHELLIKKCGV
jgi:fucose permease